MFLVEAIPAKMLDVYIERPDAAVIDLRSREEYEKSHVQGALSLPYEEIDEKTPFPGEKILVFYCDRGGASLMLARKLARRGYVTKSVIGGFAAYRGRHLVYGQQKEKKTGG